HGGELAGQNLVQQIDDTVVTLHAALPGARYGDSTLSRGWSQRAQSIISWICSVQAPQPVPAWQARPTSSTVDAPSLIAELTWRSVTRLQMQTIIFAVRSLRRRGSGSLGSASLEGRLFPPPSLAHSSL